MSDDDGAVVMVVLVGASGPDGGTGVVGATGPDSGAVGPDGGAVGPTVGPPISPTSKLACLRNSLKTRCCNRRPRRDTPDTYNTARVTAMVDRVAQPAKCVALTSATLAPTAHTLTWAYPLT